MIVAPHQEVNREELFNIIEESRNLVSPIKAQKGQHVVIAQGFSGVGKSSMVLTLSGESMVGYHHTESMVPILMSKDKSGRDGIKIEKEILAGTIRPACASMDRSKFKEKVTLWDMPGIGENRGLTQSLINSYYCMKIFQAQPSIKIALVITHGDINLGNKGINLSNVFGDFLKMFGSVQQYEKSLFVVVTKAPQFFKKEHVLSSFAKIANLPSIKNNYEVSSLVSKIANNTVPTIVFNEPDLGNILVGQQNQKEVSKDYTNFIEDFYRTVTSLQSSKDLKLRSAAMSSEQIDKCLKFADEIREEMENLILQLSQRLIQFINECRPKIGRDSSLGQIREAAKYIEFMRTFIQSFLRIVYVIRGQDKQQLKQKFLELSDIILSYQITTLDPQQQKMCPLLHQIDHCFVLIGFLNHLNFNKKEKYEWIDQIKAMNSFFRRLEELKIYDIWMEKVEVVFKRNLQEVLEHNFSLHLEELQKSEIYVIWSNIFKFFPSFALGISNYLPVHQIKRKQYTKQFFLQLHQQENLVGINSKEISMINEIIIISDSLKIQWEQSIVSEMFAPMLQDKLNQMINKVIKYETWSQELVLRNMEVFSRYCKTRKENKITDQEYVKQEQSMGISIDEWAEDISDQVNPQRAKIILQQAKIEDEVPKYIQQKALLKNHVDQLQFLLKTKQAQLQEAANKIQLQKKSVEKCNKRIRQLQDAKKSIQNQINALRKQLVDKDNIISLQIQQKQQLSSMVKQSEERAWQYYKLFNNKEQQYKQMLKKSDEKAKQSDKASRKQKEQLNTFFNKKEQQYKQKLKKSDEKSYQSDKTSKKYKEQLMESNQLVRKLKQLISQKNQKVEQLENTITRQRYSIIIIIIIIIFFAISIWWKLKN